MSLVPEKMSVSKAAIPPTSPQRRPLHQVLLGGGLFLVAMLVVSCDGGSDSTSPGPDRKSAGVDRSRIAQSKKTECPPELTGTPKRSTCKIADLAVELERCGSAGPGGYQVRVAGISCQEGLRLRLALGDPIRGYQRRSEVVYQPWIAAGPLSKNLRPSKPTGWTCWAGFDPEAAEILHVCWRGSDVLLFKRA